MQSAMDSTASNFSGTTAPTPKFVGQQYYDTANKKLYICTAIADDGTGTWTDIFSDMVAAAKKEALSEAHPVGSYYFSDKPTNPGTLFGGTWEAVDPGRALVAQGTATAEDGSTLTFTAGNKYGEFKHQLTVGELPRIIPTISVEDASVTQESNTSYFRWGNGLNYRFYTMQNDHDLIGLLGQNQAHNNIAPSISAYIWCRTA